MRTYCVVVGSKSFFDKTVEELFAKTKIDDTAVLSFLELIRILDAQKQANIEEKVKTSLLLVRNTDYNGIVNEAHDRLGPLIEDITNDDAIIIVHNPPRVLYEYLQHSKSRGKIALLDGYKEQYCIKRDPSKFSSSISEISNVIIGQDNAIYEISKSLWFLTTVQQKKPYVIMLYGNSSLGKTELAREIAKHFFDEKMFEKHLSMFKNNNYSDYFFGEEPNRRSIGFDLLERTSNLIFLDELDKCPDFFYSAFYTLFDNEIFKDATYDVDISGAIIVLTSNYHNESEIKQNLGLPIFYRIDKFIKFEDFSSDIIYKITKKEIESRREEYKEFLTSEQVYEVVSKRIGSKDENARTIKYKIQQVIEELLFCEIKKIDNSSDS